MRSSARFVASMSIAVAFGALGDGVRLTHAQPLAARPAPAAKPDAKPDAKIEQVFADPKYQLTDSDSISRDRFLYISTSQVHTAPPFHGGADKRTLPYGLFRLKLP